MERNCFAEAHPLFNGRGQACLLGISSVRFDHSFTSSGITVSSHSHDWKGCEAVRIGGVIRIVAWNDKPGNNTQASLEGFASFIRYMVRDNLMEEEFMLRTFIFCASQVDTALFAMHCKRVRTRWATVMTTLALLFSAIFLFGLRDSTAHAEGIVFTDPVFEQMLRSALNRPEEPIYREELDQFGAIFIDTTTMRLTQTEWIQFNLEEWAGDIWSDHVIRGLVDGEDYEVRGYALESAEVQGKVLTLQDLSYFNNLQYLWVNVHPIIDLTPLAGLMRLKFLSLSYNAISDLTPLADLPQLLHVSLMYNNRVTDILPLANLTQLRTLILVDCSIRDITPLAALKSLEYLDLGANMISDVKPIEGLAYLKTLMLGNNQIKDLLPLMNMASLEKLSLSGNNITDLSPLVSLHQLTDLELMYNNITDIMALKGLMLLRVLNLEHNNISDVTPIEDLSLYKLNLKDNPITNWIPVCHVKIVEGRYCE